MQVKYSLATHNVHLSALKGLASFIRTIPIPSFESKAFVIFAFSFPFP